MTDIQDIITKAKEGHTDPLFAFITLKQLADEVDAGLAELKSIAMQEAEKYGKSFDKYGAHIELRNAPGRWNFEAIPSIKQVEERLKYLKKLAEIGGVDAESGELIERATKIEGQSTIAIKLLKNG